MEVISDTDPSPETRQQPPESTELEILSEAVPQEQNGRYAVTVRHAHMQYANIIDVSLKRSASNFVLKDLNMTVERGHVYGLLGASGCGKTTILRAIVGDHTLTSGKINVLGNVPGARGSGAPGTMIGYMPQELSLLEELTIIENLYFYGWLAGMSTEEIDTEAEKHIKLLDLPNKTRLVTELSGGQQRRVSFAIALLHSPPVLVLDEPTVGVDPLLRENIWNHINKLAKKDGTTVIISTHYIEEASGADIIGLMRHGKLIAEQSPSTLLQSLGCSDLEVALWKLCVHQSSVEKSQSESLELLDKVAPVNEADVSSETAICVHKNVSPNKRIRALIWKNSTTQVRQYGATSFLLLLPAILLALCCISIGRRPEGLYLSVVNQEVNCTFDGPTSIENLRQEDINRTTYNTCDMPSYFSCSMLKILKDRQIFIVPFETEESAKEFVRRGKSWGAVVFQQNFTQALLQRVGSPSDFNEKLFETGTVHLSMDQSDAIISVSIEYEMINALKKVLSDFDDECHTLKHIKEIPIRMNPPVYGSFSKSSYRDYTLSAFLPGTILMFGLTSTMAAFLPEKIRGVLSRSVVSGVTPMENLAAHFAVQAVNVFLQDAVMLLTVFTCFEIYNVGNFGTIALLSVPIAINGMMLGFIIALVCGRFMTACLTTNGIYFCALICSGGLWPIEAVPTPARQVMWLLPITAQTQAFRHVLQRGWTIANYSIQAALGASLAYGICFIFSLTIIYRYRRLFQNLL